MWSSTLVPGTRAPKALIISRVIGVRRASFIIHNKPLSTIPEFVLMR